MKSKIISILLKKRANNNLTKIILRIKKNMLNIINLIFHIKMLRIMV